MFNSLSIKNSTVLRFSMQLKTNYSFLRSCYDRGTQTFGLLEGQNSIKALQYPDGKGILRLEQKIYIVS